MTEPPSAWSDSMLRRPRKNWQPFWHLPPRRKGIKGPRWLQIFPLRSKVSSTISSPSENQADKAVKSDFLGERKRLFSKGAKKRVLSEREVFLKKTHLESFPNWPKLFSKDLISSLKEGSLWRNFSQDTEFVQTVDSYECIRIFSGDQRWHKN